MNIRTAVSTAVGSGTKRGARGAWAHVRRCRQLRDFVRLSKRAFVRVGFKRRKNLKRRTEISVEVTQSFDCKRRPRRVGAVGPVVWPPRTARGIRREWAVCRVSTFGLFTGSVNTFLSVGLWFDSAIHVKLSDTRVGRSDEIIGDGDCPRVGAVAPGAGGADPG
jgi:hypothetical protein